MGRENKLPIFHSEAALFSQRYGARVISKSQNGSVSISLCRSVLMLAIALCVHFLLKCWHVRAAGANISRSVIAHARALLGNAHVYAVGNCVTAAGRGHYLPPGQ